MPIKERLQRRLAEQRKAAGASAPATQSESGVAWDYSVSNAALDKAEKCGRSLVEELIPPDKLVFNWPAGWSLHRKVTALSLRPGAAGQRRWRELVETYGLRQYFATRRALEVFAALRVVAKQPAVHLVSDHEFTPYLAEGVRSIIYRKDSAQLSLWDLLFLLILFRLDDADMFCITQVCRRWHAMARCMWTLAQDISFGDVVTVRKSDPLATTTNERAAVAWLPMPSTVLYRMPMLTCLMFCGGVRVNLESLLAACKPMIFLSSFCLRRVKLTSSLVSIADASEKASELTRSVPQLAELMLSEVEVCFIDRSRDRREVRCLELKGQISCEAQPKTGLRTNFCVFYIQLSANVFHRHNQLSFKDFCKQLVKLWTEAVIFSGSTGYGNAPGLPRAVFEQCFADLMPKLREVSLCNVSFPDGKGLNSDTMDVFAKAVRRISKLELFCLTEGEISEEAICNLQRCGKLQIIILLQCEITKADPELRFMAGWHPNAALPSTLITDAKTTPQKLRPRYFRVVRVKGFSAFSEARFSELRKRWWTFRALLKSATLGLADFSYTTPPLPEQEEILADLSCLF